MKTENVEINSGESVVVNSQSKNDLESMEQRF